MCEYEYEYEYLNITWVRVRILVDEYQYEYEYEYRAMIYILYKQQYCIFQTLNGECSDSYKPETKLQLLIVHVHSLCQYICLIIQCKLVQCTYCDAFAVVVDIYNLLPVQKQKAKFAQYHEMYG